MPLLTVTEQQSLLARLVVVADKLGELLKVEKHEIIIVLPPHVLRQSIAIHGHKIVHEESGPAVSWHLPEI